MNRDFRGIKAGDVERVRALPEYLRPVLAGLAAGLSYKEIAVREGLTDRTVRVYAERLYSRLEVHSATQATRLALLFEVRNGGAR